MNATDARSDLGVPAHCILTNLGIADLLTLSFEDGTDNVKEMFTNLVPRPLRHPVLDCATRLDLTMRTCWVTSLDSLRKPPTWEELVRLRTQHLRQMSPTQTQMHLSLLTDAVDHLTEPETLRRKLMLAPTDPDGI